MQHLVRQHAGIVHQYIADHLDFRVGPELLTTMAQFLRNPRWCFSTFTYCFSHADPAVRGAVAQQCAEALVSAHKPSGETWKPEQDALKRMLQVDGVKSVVNFERLAAMALNRGNIAIMGTLAEEIPEEGAQLRLLCAQAVQLTTRCA